MRIVVVLFAALLTLGLAAFGVVAAQRATVPASHVAMAAKVEPAAPAAPLAAAPRPVAQPVSQIAQTPAAEPAPAPATAVSTSTIPRSWVSPST